MAVETKKQHPFFVFFFSLAPSPPRSLSFFAALRRLSVPWKCLRKQKCNKPDRDRFLPAREKERAAFFLFFNLGFFSPSSLSLSLSVFLLWQRARPQLPSPRRAQATSKPARAGDSLQGKCHAGSELGSEKKKRGEREREGLEREREREKKVSPLSQGCFFYCSFISFPLSLFFPSTTSDSPLRFFLSRDAILLLEFLLLVFP